MTRERIDQTRLATHPAVRAFIRVPLFHKILLANLAVVALATGVGAAVVLAGRASGSPGPLVVGIAGAVVVALGIAANALLVRLALSPLRHLEETARRVEGGDLEARAPESPMADRDLERLTDVFNRMLESVWAGRRRHRQLAARARRAEERERLRVARELYDDTAQMLAAVLLRLRIASRSPRLDPEETAQLEELRRGVVDALEGVRGLARGLRPPELDEIGAGAAFEAHARHVADAAGISIRVDAPRGDLGLSPEAALNLYRILQEALDNAIHHGEARHVVARFRHRPGGVLAELEDDGRGFDVPTTLDRGDESLGLFEMRERAAQVDGTVAFLSRPGTGTRVRVAIPGRDPSSGARAGTGTALEAVGA